MPQDEISFLENEIFSLSKVLNNRVVTKVEIEVGFWFTTELGLDWEEVPSRVIEKKLNENIDAIKMHELVVKKMQNIKDIGARWVKNYDVPKEDVDRFIEDTLENP